MPPDFQKEGIAGFFPLGHPTIIRNVAHMINTHFDIPKVGRTDPETVIRAAISASGDGDSISSYSKDRQNLPSHTTCLKCLHALKIEQLIQENNALLLQAAKKVIQPGSKGSFAIDTNYEPYYGERDGEFKEYIVGSKRVASTNWFYGYVTLYVVIKDQHVTLAIFPLKQGFTPEEIVRMCVKTLQDNDFSIEMLCLDRGFYAANVFQYLQGEGIPHIVPAKRLKGAVQAKLTGRKSTEFEYILNEENTNAIPVTIVDCVVYLRKKHDKRGTAHHRFVVFGISASPRRIREIYSHRFGIESSYRMKNEVKAKTTSKDPVIRYFYKIIAFVLQNVRISIKWVNFVKAQRGPKTVEKNKFDLNLLVNVIRDAANILFPLNKIRALNLDWM